MTYMHSRQGILSNRAVKICLIDIAVLEFSTNKLISHRCAHETISKRLTWYEQIFDADFQNKK